MRKKGESKDWNHQTVTAVDWNAAASPPDAWLNQSAVPSVVLVIGTWELSRSENDPIAQELEDIRVFRNVHVVTASEI